MAKKKKSWLAVVGVVLSALLAVGIVSNAFPAEEKCDHVFDEGKVVVAATCTTEGKKVFTCSECGETGTFSISKGPHDFVYNGSDDACCSVCDDSIVNCSFTEFDDLNSLETGWYSYDVANYSSYNDGFISGCIKVLTSEGFHENVSVDCVYDSETEIFKFFGELSVTNDGGDVLDKFPVEFSPVSFVIDDTLYFYLDSDAVVTVYSEDGDAFAGRIIEFLVHDSSTLCFLK